MSYILDALKRAEAERNGAIHRPGPLLPPIAAASKHPPAWRRPLPVAAMAALAVTLACAAWFSVSRPAADKTSASSTTSSTTSSPPPSAAPEPVATAPVPEPKVAPPAIPATAAAEPERPKVKPAPKKAPEKKRAAPPKEAKTAKAPPPEPAIGALKDLPPLIQREIPPVAVGGYIYSGNKADRSVLINNRLLREGDEAAPGLVLEKMTPTGMVFSYKGYRYRRGYK